MINIDSCMIYIVSEYGVLVLIIYCHVHTDDMYQYTLSRYHLQGDFNGKYLFSSSSILFLDEDKVVHGTICLSDKVGLLAKGEQQLCRMCVSIGLLQGGNLCSD